MSPRNWRERIDDILKACNEIISFTGDMDFDSFEKDLKSLRAIELNFIIIGEAVSDLPDSVVDSHPEIPWRLMRAMRNRLVHVYFEVDPKLVWDTIKNDLPGLIESLQQL